MIINDLEDKKIIYISNNEIFYDDHTSLKYPGKIEKLFDEICLTEFTALKGRKEAIKILFGYKNNPPLYLIKNIVLIKIEDIIKNTTLYLNTIYITKIEKEGINCKVYFINNTFLFLCLDIKYLKRQLEKAYKITNSYNKNFI